MAADVLFICSRYNNDTIITKFMHVLVVLGAVEGQKATSKA